MKKIDKLIIGSFLGPFFLTFFVVIFILLSQFMLKYLDEIVGKDLDTSVIIQLIFYFSIFMTPNAFPLAVLLSSLMTFGNLGEHFELTAMKGSGISLIRVMIPIFVFTLVLTAVAYYSNNNIVPQANLKAFSLLYDVKQKKPSMELKEGAFYNGIDGYSIKVGKKLSDGTTLKDLTIYDHTAGQGNVQVTLADSGKMYNILQNRYLVLELFDGHTYVEDKNRRHNYVAQQQPEPMIRNNFKSQKIVFSLASFDLKRTKEELFSSNRLMKNAQHLAADVDSMRTDYKDKTEEVKEHSFRFFNYHLQDIVGIYKQRALEREERKRKKQAAKEAKFVNSTKNVSKDSTEMDDSLKNIELKSRATSYKKKGGISPGSRKIIDERIKKLKAKKLTQAKGNIKKSMDMDSNQVAMSEKAVGLSKMQIDSKKNINVLDSVKAKPTFEENIAKIDSLMNSDAFEKNAYNKSLTHVRFVKNNMMMRRAQLEKIKTEINKFQLERFKKFSYAMTILIMFFIGAPLGSIIKKGGLGVPVLISLSFFILFYVISMICEKWTRTDVMDPLLAAWMANIILFPVGMFFMKQAKNDARLFESDFYNVIFLKLKGQIFKLKGRFKKTNSLN